MAGSPDSKLAPTTLAEHELQGIQNHAKFPVEKGFVTQAQAVDATGKYLQEVAGTAVTNADQETLAALRKVIDNLSVILDAAPTKPRRRKK